MQYQTYPTSQSWKYRLRLPFQKSSKNDLVWKPGDPLWREKNKNCRKPFIFTTWTILSDLEQKKSFEKNFDGSSNMAIFGRYGSAAKIVFFEPNFFQNWNFQGLFLAILSTISEYFSKIVRLVLEKKFEKVPKNSF